MSYSRWSNSMWYTFWSEASGSKKEDQVFEVCSLCSFTYGQLTSEKQKCLDKVLAIVKEEWKPEAVESADLNELNRYMDEFIADVDENFINIVKI